jgi:SAM-dependent methyltransferase
MIRRNQNAWELLLISFAALFLEMVVIRWLASEVRIFAYFKNLPLMAAFLGFGIGLSQYQRGEQLFRWFPRLIAYLVIIIAGAAKLGITHVVFVDPRQYFLLGGGFGDHVENSLPSLLQTVQAIFVMVSIFFLVMATFAALTSKVGQLLNREKPLSGYSVNVAGSLLGILAFSWLSHLQWSPVLWLACAFTVILYFYRGWLKLPLVYFGAALAWSIFMNYATPAIWSPYYRIAVETGLGPGYAGHVTVNYDGFQAIQFPLAKQGDLNRHYNIPYNLSKGELSSVLILGGGSGNDAAAALRNGSERVDVVEIDPAIVQIGRKLHPEKPYDSPKVNLVVDDARSFLQKTKATYDLVVFATLDSHTVFSSLSSLRLDNFVFTRESVKAAWSKLNPGGGIAINFFAIKPWLSQRHLDTLKEVSSSVPLVYASAENMEVILLAGTRFDPHQSLGITNYYPASPDFGGGNVELTTDDWPFLFLEKRGIPFHYLLPLFVILALSYIPLRGFKLRVRDLDGQLFFMGAGFLLVETKAVTTLALIFGSTWMVNSIVVGAILVTILLANLVVARLSGPSETVLYVGLFGCLLFNFFFSFDRLNQWSWEARLVASSAIVASPIFFAALIFAKRFRTVSSPSLALASNLLGSLVGGLLEYLDMWTGLRGLNLVALLVYLISFLFLLSLRKVSPVSSAVFQHR